MKCDICVYGGSAGGVVAAVAAARAGHSVLLIEPGRHLGGMSSGGLGMTDFGNTEAIGGIAREFYRRLGARYGQAEAWTFEPHVAEAVCQQLVSESGIRVLTEHRLTHVQQSQQRLTQIAVEHAPTDRYNAPQAAPQNPFSIVVSARVFIDASYEGDLMAAAGVSFTVGRESVEHYGESLNGIRGDTPKHQFRVAVDPYVRRGDASSGLLPLIQEGNGGKPGDGDHRVQAYNFRLCLTQEPANTVAIEPPEGYDASRFELLARELEACEAVGIPLDVPFPYYPPAAIYPGNDMLFPLLLKIDAIPNGKSDVNNAGSISTDFVGGSWGYPQADYGTRGRIWREHIRYTQGLLHFLASSARVPLRVRRQMQRWGLCRDEFTDTHHWPHQLYVREARRMLGRYVITQIDCERDGRVSDSIGMAAYAMDSHNCQRVVQNGVVRNEGDVQVCPNGPYAISYRAMTPRTAQCDNLLVPVCLSASHIAYGSLRMEPVFMVLGESAALAASAALRADIPVQRVDVPRLQQTLADAGQILGTRPGPQRRTRRPTQPRRLSAQRS